MNQIKKNPLEIAIAAVESCTRHGGLTDYQGYLAKMSSLRGGEVIPVEDRAYLDHALRILIDAGHMRRHHVGPGKLAYGPTPTWKDRDVLLAPLRYRKPTVRAWRIRLAEKKRAEKVERQKVVTEQREQAKLDQRMQRKEAKRQHMIATRGLTPTGKIRRKSRALSMIARGDLPLQQAQQAQGNAS